MNISRAEVQGNHVFISGKWNKTAVNNGGTILTLPLEFTPAKTTGMRFCGVALTQATWLAGTSHYFGIVARVNNTGTITVYSDTALPQYYGLFNIDFFI